MTKTQLENMTVKELKDLVKDWSASTGEALPTGLWKMTKSQLLEFLEELYADILEEETGVEVVIPEEKEEEKEVKPENKTSQKRSKVIIFTDENGEVTEVNGVCKFHQFMKDNHKEWSSWPMLKSVLTGQPNNKGEKFLAAGLNVEFAEGYEYGASNQYTNKK